MEKAFGFARVSSDEQAKGGISLGLQAEAIRAYCKQRGLNTENAISMVVNGFCKEVFRELPMEFAVEATKLLSVSLDGSVG